MKNEFLKKVDETLTERGEQYGDNLPEIARRWSILFGVDISRELACLAMMELKMVRLGQNPKSVDSFVDICGYACLSREPLVSEIDSVEVDGKKHKKFADGSWDVDPAPFVARKTDGLLESKPNWEYPEHMDHSTHKYETEQKRLCQICNTPRGDHRGSEEYCPPFGGETCSLGTSFVKKFDMRAQVEEISSELVYPCKNCGFEFGDHSTQLNRCPKATTSGFLETTFTKKEDDHA